MAYKSISQKTAIAAQQQRLQQFADATAEQTTEADGLLMVPGSEAEMPEHLEGFELGLPAELSAWLRDLALLRNLPLAYLLPDPRLLPAEAIRFFHVDRSWTDRMIDGALSAASLGSLDVSYRLHTLVALRRVVDDSLDALVDRASDKTKDFVYPWSASDPNARITGMLIRSELVRRWPQLIVDGFRDLDPGDSADLRYRSRVRLLRKELLAKDLMIVLFAGMPKRVEVKEPNVAVRYGIELVDTEMRGTKFQVNCRLPNGDFVESGSNMFVSVPTRTEGSRTLDLVGTHQTIDASWTALNAVMPGNPGYERVGSRGVALNLEQKPYVQVFAGGDEAEGHEFPKSSPRAPSSALRGSMTLRNGSPLKLHADSKGGE